MDELTSWMNRDGVRLRANKAASDAADGTLYCDSGRLLSGMPRGVDQALGLSKRVFRSFVIHEPTAASRE